MLAHGGASVQGICIHPLQLQKSGILFQLSSANMEYERVEVGRERGDPGAEEGKRKAGTGVGSDLEVL